MKKFIYSAMSAAILLGTATSAFAGCDSPKNEACQGECSRIYPNDNQTHELIACAKGCAIATGCMDTIGG